MSPGADPRPQTQSTPRLLFVGRDRDAHVAALIAAGYHVVGVDSMREALDHRPRPDGVILELILPDHSMADLTDWRAGPHTAAITVIGLAAEERRDAVVKAGATFCRHPCPPEELVAILRQVIPLRPPESPA